MNHADDDVWCMEVVWGGDGWMDISVKLDVISTGEETIKYLYARGFQYQYDYLPILAMLLVCESFTYTTVD